MTPHQVVEIFPLQDDTDAESMIGLHNNVWAELLGDRAPSNVDEYRARHSRSSMDQRHFVVQDEDQSVIGLLITVQWNDGSNEHFQFAQIFVDLNHRRRGIAKALLAKAYEVGVASGRNTISLDTLESVPAGEAFCLAMGATVAMREHINIVDVADLDIEMLERWRSEGPGRAPGYEMLVWEDGYPEEFFGPVADLWFMADEDMPFEDLDMEPAKATAEEVAEILEQNLGLVERITAMPRHIDSGELVGFSELIRAKSDPENIQTTLTMIHRDHRGHALGKWAKAAAILRGVERWPAGIRVKTENAKSNDAMLAINNAIGFEPRNSLVSYQTTTDVIAKYLGLAK